MNKETWKKISSFAWKTFKKTWWIILGTLVMLFLLKKGSDLIATIGKPKKKMNFFPDPRDKTKIFYLDNKGSYVSIDLPKGVKSKDVVAVGVDSKSRKILVEVKHEIEDLRDTRSPLNAKS